MYVSFYANHIRYDYTVSFTMEHIIEELMEWFPNGSKSLFYERKYQSDDLQASIKFGQSLGLSAKTKDIFLQNTLNSYIVLSCFGKRAFESDAKPIANLHNWISRYVHQLDNPNLLYFLNTFLMNSYMLALRDVAKSMKEKEETERNYTYSQMAEQFEALEKASGGGIEWFVRFVKGLM